MAELEVTKVAEQLNHQVLYSVRLSADANRTGISDRHPRSGISARKRSRRPCVYACLSGRARGCGTPPVTLSNAPDGLILRPSPG